MPDPTSSATTEGAPSMTERDLPTIGFVGLGRMGAPMAANLLGAGYPVLVYDVDPDRCSRLQKAGARVAGSPAEVARQSQISFSIIMNDAILRQVALGDNGIAVGAEPGHLYCDLSTVSPAVSAEVAAALADKDVGYLRGKVAGSVTLAEAGTLTVFASGSAADFDQARPALEVVGQRVIYVGDADVAIYLKLVHSAIVAVYAALIGEALTLGERGGVNFEQMLDILTEGPLASTQLALKTPMLKSRGFGDNPPSDIDTAVKDLDLVLGAANANAVPMPLTAAVRQIMSAQQAAGGGKRDIWSVLEVFESMAALDTQSLR